MEKEKFLEILEKYKVPACVHEKWWNNLMQHHFVFCCGDSEHAMLDFCRQGDGKRMRNKRPMVVWALYFLAFFCHNGEVVGGFALCLFGTSADEAEAII